MVQMMDPLSVADLVLRTTILIGFTCFIRPNSYHQLKFGDLTFPADNDENGNLRIEIVVAVPDSKSVAYAAAVGGLARKVKLQEFGIRDLCAVRTLVALGQKLGVFDCDFREACDKCRFVVKPMCLDWYVLLAVEGGVLTPTKTVSWWFSGGGSLLL